MRISRVIYWATATIAVCALYAPMIVVLFFSFNAAPRGMIWQGFSLHWYSDVWSDAILLDSSGNTLKVVFLTCSLSLIGGVAAGFLISTAGKRTFVLITAILFVPI